MAIRGLCPLINPRMEKMAKKTIGKKGIFFTSIAIIISAVIITMFVPQTISTTTDQIPLTKAKAEAASEHARDLTHSYLPQSIAVAGYSAFSALAEYMRQRGNYLSSDQIFNITFKELMLNGTICCGLDGSCNIDLITEVQNPSLHKGVDDCLGMQVMRDRNLTKRLADMENASVNAFRITTRFNKAYNGLAVSLFQDNSTGPWQVGIKASINYSIVAGDVTINNSENVTSIFSIEGIPDPLYLVESPKSDEDASGGADGILYTNYFNATNVTGWNISTFFRQVEWRFYRADSSGSSFLNRFYGKDEKSPCCGVESLINPLVMTTVNGRIEKPYVDWCYYGTANRCTPAQAGALWNISCVTTEVDGTKFHRFALDTYHALRYNLSNAQKDYLYGVGPPPTCPESPAPG